MKKILLLLLVFSQAFTFAQTTPSYKNVKLTAVPLGVKNDSLVLWNGSTKLLKHLPISEIKTPTNITSIASPTNVSILSSTGTGAEIPLSTTVNSGLQSPADKTKINGIASGATANQTDAYLLSRANHTGTQDASTVTGLNRSSVGLGNVDNTSDVNKPISTATQNALNTKLSTFGSGTNNYIQKVIGTNVLGNTRLFDDGTYLGIGNTKAPTKDITLGNQNEKQIGVEESSSTSFGKSLKITAGRTINYTSSFVLGKLIITPGNYPSAFSNPINGDVYVSLWESKVHKQNSGIGSFSQITESPTGVQGGCVTYSGDIYVVTYSSGIKKQTGGVGAFADVSGTTGINFSSMCSTPNGDVYASVGGNPPYGRSSVAGDIYKQTGGVGAFVAMGVLNSNAVLSAATNGDVYVATFNGSIYRINSGTSVLIDLLVPAKQYVGIAVIPNTSDFYVSEWGGDIYFYSGGAMVAKNQAGVDTQWAGLVVNKNLILTSTSINSVYSVDINSLGIENLDGGTLKLISGTGKGTGSSKIQFITGQKTASGTDMQVETVRGVIDETGLMTLPTTTNALISADVTGKAVVTKEYLNTTIQAPFLTELIPDSYLPSNTGNFILKGAFFTPGMTVVVEGQTVNYKTFISDNEVRVNLTTGAAEGAFNVTLNNGVSSFYPDRFLVVLGTVFKPTFSDWVNVVQPINVSEEGTAKTVTFNSIGSAEWSKVLDNNKNYSVRIMFEATELGVFNQGFGFGFPFISLLNASDNAMRFEFLHKYNGDTSIEANSATVNNHDLIGGTFSSLSAKEYEFRKIGTVMYVYVDAVLAYTYPDVINQDLKIKVKVRDYNLKNIKYIELAN